MHERNALIYNFPLIFTLDGASISHTNDGDKKTTINGSSQRFIGQSKITKHFVSPILYALNNMLKGKRYDKNVKLLAYYDPKVISSGLFSEFESYILFPYLCLKTLKII